MDLITTGAGQATRRARADLKREILALVDASGRTGLRWSAAIHSLESQSSIPIDHSEFAEVIRTLVDEGVLKVIGERDRRTIRRIAA